MNSTQILPYNKYRQENLALLQMRLLMLISQMAKYEKKKTRLSSAEKTSLTLEIISIKAIEFSNSMKKKLSSSTVTSFKARLTAKNKSQMTEI